MSKEAAKPSSHNKGRGHDGTQTNAVQIREALICTQADATVLMDGK